MTRFLAVSSPPEGSTEGQLVVRSLPEGNRLWAATYPLSRTFKPAVVTCDAQLIVICGQEDGTTSKKSG